MSACAICLDDSPTDVWGITKCNHLYHEHCYQNLEFQNMSPEVGANSEILYTAGLSCPVCRSDLREDDHTASKLRYKCGRCVSDLHFRNLQMLALHLFGCRAEPRQIQLNDQAALDRAAQIVVDIPERDGDVYCYNCQRRTNHVSKYCPERQTKTRCPTCDRVTMTQFHHHISCSTKEFVSIPIVYHVPSMMYRRLSFDMGEHKVFGIEGHLLLNNNPIFFGSLNTTVQVLENKLEIFTLQTQMLDVLIKLNGADVIRVECTDVQAKANGSVIIKDDQVVLLNSESQQNVFEHRPNIIVEATGEHATAEMFYMVFRGKKNTFMTRPGGSSWYVPRDFEA